MLHIITVHWKDARWVDLQLEYLKRYLTIPYRVYAWLNDLPEVPSNKFFYTCREPVESHSIKLNLLAEIASLHSESPNDFILFLDGDAFPVADLTSTVFQPLTTYPLVAVQRLENNGDNQPHPCFCVTTLRFWREIKGDWKDGYEWKNANGQSIKDVGGNLLRQLEVGGRSWLPLHRSHEDGNHHLFFCLYAGVLYHHGCGFRPSHCRSDELHIPGFWPNKIYKYLLRLPHNRWTKKLKHHFDPLKKIREDNHRKGLELYQKILLDRDFHRHFRKV